jgi:hypothetical protein
MTGAVAMQSKENSDLADVHECKLHEPSADMTNAGKRRARKNSDQDVHECDIANAIWRDDMDDGAVCAQR